MAAARSTRRGCAHNRLNICTSEYMDDRARHLLKTLIERYIADGHPVGSRALSKYSALELSAATVRNVMADLEDLGLITSPHTSAGRIPTPQGYRVFVDSLITVQPLEGEQTSRLRGEIVSEDPRRVMVRAAGILSRLSNFAGVVMAPRRAQAFRQLEFVRLSERRLLLIIVTSDGDVQNRIIPVDRDFSASDLVEASNFINQHFAGMEFDLVRGRLRTELAEIRQDISALMERAIEAGINPPDAQDGDDVLISGERNFVNLPDFEDKMSRLRELFRLFEKRTELLQLLDASSHAEGVQIFIGGESKLVPMDELSVVAAPFEVDGRVVGTLGVIGPTRMAYQRMIPIVDITARLVSDELTQMKRET